MIYMRVHSVLCVLRLYISTYTWCCAIAPLRVCSHSVLWHCAYPHIPGAVLLHLSVFTYIRCCDIVPLRICIHSVLCYCSSLYLHTLGVILLCLSASAYTRAWCIRTMCTRTHTHILVAWYKYAGTHAGRMVRMHHVQVYADVESHNGTAFRVCSRVHTMRTSTRTHTGPHHARHKRQSCM